VRLEKRGREREKRVRGRKREKERGGERGREVLKREEIVTKAIEKSKTKEKNWVKATHRYEKRKREKRNITVLFFFLTSKPLESKIQSIVWLFYQQLVFT
jgi:hypothetical protein